MLLLGLERELMRKNDGNVAEFSCSPQNMKAFPTPRSSLPHSDSLRRISHCLLNTANLPFRDYNYRGCLEI